MNKRGKDKSKTPSVYKSNSMRTDWKCYTFCTEFEENLLIFFLRRHTHT
jgi:hypothetical protein